MAFEPHWQWWQRMTQPPAPAPEPKPREADAWTLEKASNRLQKKLRQVASGFLQPRVAYAMTGEAARELDEARALLTTIGHVLTQEKGGCDGNRT